MRRSTGLRLYESGQFQEAIPYFDQVLASHSRDLEILIKRGSCYLRMNQPLKALDDFDRVNQYSAWSSRVFGAAYLHRQHVDAMPTRLPLPKAGEPRNRPLDARPGRRGPRELSDVDLPLEPAREPAVERATTATEPSWSAVRPAPTKGSARLTSGSVKTSRRSSCTARRSRSTRPTRMASPGRADVLATLKLLDAADTDYSEAIRLDSDAFTGPLRTRDRPLRPGP